MFVVRNDQVQVDREAAAEVVDQLAHAEYTKKARLEDAPVLADCVTATVYFFAKACKFSLSPYKIGDMPRMLCKVHGWQIVSVNSWTSDDCDLDPTLRDCDLVFARTNGTPRMIGHIGWVLDKQICHFSSTGMHQEEPVEFFTGHSQPYQDETGEPTKLLTYVDRRNTLGRMVYPSGYIVKV